jgi:nitrite reductase (NADH) small subunit
MSDPFIRIGRAADVPFLEGRTADVDGTRVAVFRTETGFVAIGAECPHEGGPLADGIVADRCVTCPLHNWRIDLETGEVVGGGEGSVPVFEIEERDGELFVSVPALARP